jgi:hypothetical protein
LSKHATTGLVAAVVVAVSLGEGGYSPGMRAAIAFAAWATVLGGVALGVFPRFRTPVAALIASGMLGGLALLSGISVAWASDDGAAIEATLLVAAYLGIFALVVCVAREGDARSWLVGLALGIAFVGALAILTRLISGLPGGDDEIARLLPSARGRLSYPIGYWNGTAALLALGVVLVAWLGAFARTAAARAVSVSAIPMLALGIYLASSRGGFAALVVGVVVLIAIGPCRPALVASLAIGTAGAGLVIALASSQTALLDATGPDADSQGLELLGALAACILLAAALRLAFDGWLERVRVTPAAARASVAVVLIACLGGAVATDPGKRFDEFKSVPATEGAGQTDFIASHLSSGSGSGRWQFWGVALDAFGDQPAHGIGAGGYADYWTQHAPITRVTKQAHSLYLEELGDLGPLGLVLVLGFLVVPVVAWSGRRVHLPGGEPGAALAVTAAGALSAAIDWTFQIPAVFGVVVVALALLAGPSLVSGAGEGEAARARRLPLRVGLVLVACAALLLAGDQLLARRSLDASQSAVRANDLAGAADDARRAIALEPWAAQPRLQLALVQESAGALSQASSSVNDAIVRAPDDWSLWLVRARIATKAGRIAEANAALERSRALNPRAPLFSAF